MAVKSVALSMAMLGMASGHIIMQAVGVNGKDYEQGYGIYMPSDNSFINDVTSDSLACNGSPVSGFKSSSEVIPVKAGDTVTGNWLHTLTSTGADGSADNKVIDSSHKGPVMAYMKKVDDATQNPSAGPGDGWFKIAEAGLISSSQWAVDALIEAGGVQTVTIPSCIEDGDYLLRFELIALHDGTKPNGAQFYMECAQISVSGGTGGSTPATVSIPGAYSASDPGISFNVYNDQGQPYPKTDYIIPGPELFTCGAGSSSPQPQTPSTGGSESSQQPQQSSTGATESAAATTFGNDTAPAATSAAPAAPSASEEAECSVEYVYV